MMYVETSRASSALGAEVSQNEKVHASLPSPRRSSVPWTIAILDGSPPANSTLPTTFVSIGDQSAGSPGRYAHRTTGLPRNDDGVRSRRSSNSCGVSDAVGSDVCDIPGSALGGGAVGLAVGTGIDGTLGEPPGNSLHPARPRSTTAKAASDRDFIG
jgi:hypothetical protein